MHFAEITFGPDRLDELTQLELRVAKRAEELWRLTRGARPDRELWQQAEAEIWQQGPGRPAGGGGSEPAGDHVAARAG